LCCCSLTLVARSGGACCLCFCDFFGDGSQWSFIFRIRFHHVLPSKSSDEQLRQAGGFGVHHESEPVPCDFEISIVVLGLIVSFFAFFNVVSVLAVVNLHRLTLLVRVVANCGLHTNTGGVALLPQVMVINQRPNMFFVENSSNRKRAAFSVVLSVDLEGAVAFVSASDDLTLESTFGVVGLIELFTHSEVTGGHFLARKSVS
jgi:hypothetical protein